jgi:hypothetical protein
LIEFALFPQFPTLEKLFVTKWAQYFPNWAFDPFSVLHEVVFMGQLVTATTAISHSTCL